jgi:sugar phosphate isomerase/epimerase
VKLGYGNYGMPDVEPAQLVPGLADMGYEGLEICTMRGWPTEPTVFDSQARRLLRRQIDASNLEFTALLDGYQVLSDDVDQEIERFRRACNLATALSSAEGAAVVTSTLGGGPDDWESAKDVLVERCGRFADVASAEGCCFAIEGHAGGLLDRPERVRWLLETCAHPALATNFDISHFLVAGYDMGDAIRTLVPLAVHAHVKDAALQDGKVRFLLPGEGNTDYAAYFRLMTEAGWSRPITVEVSQQVFRRDGFNPWDAARASFKVLDEGRRAGGGR